MDEKKKSLKMIIIGAVTAALILAVIVASVFADGGNREYDTHLEMAQKYLDELNYEQAVVELRLAIEIEPKDSAAYFALADVYVAMEDYGNAMAVLEEGYAAAGNGELAAERERIAGEYAELQERERREQERQAEEFYEKYAELYTFAEEEVYLWLGTSEYRYLTFAEWEQAYGRVTEQLEQYLVDLDGTEGLPEQLYQDNAIGVRVESSMYFTKGRAYRYLAAAYLCMGKLEECLRVRTEWAEFCGRPDLVQDGDHRYYEDVVFADGEGEYDRYGRPISVYWESSVVDGLILDTYTYEESHGGRSHFTRTASDGQLLEEVYWTYDSEGRILQQYITGENGGVAYNYAYTGNHSFVLSRYQEAGDRTDQLGEHFYDEYGREIYP